MESKGQTSEGFCSPPHAPPKHEELRKQKIAHDLQICTTETVPGQTAGWARTVVHLSCSKTHTFINVASDLY